jgi:putative phage-type endonuclease
MSTELTESINERRSFIGGSDFTDILSLAPYGCRLKAWIRKREGAQPIEETGHIKRGKRGEEIAAEEYQAATGRVVRRYPFRMSKDHEHFGSHMDRHIVAFDDRGPGVLEIKCPSDWAFRSVKREGLSQGYVAQLQWYMLVTGWQWGAYAVFNLDRWELLHWDVQRDETLIDLLAREAHDFWRQVENGPAPQKLDPKDRRCARCEHRVRCHGEEEFPIFEGTIDFDPALAPLIAEYREAKPIFDDAEEFLEGIKDRIKAAVADRACVETNGARIYFSKQTRSSIDTKGLKSAYPEIAKRFEKTTSFRALRIYER